LKRLQDARDHLAHEGLDDAEADVALAQSLERLDLGSHPIELVIDMPRMAHQQFARRGEPQHRAARAALQQRRAEFFFEQGNLPADRRGRHEQSLGCGADRAGAHDLRESSAARRR
jgi:hypothetical protein